MNTKIISLFLLVLFFATPVLAAITVTWTSPTNNTVYNNTPANAGDVNLTFVISDDNGAVLDHNFSVIVYNDSWTTEQTLVDDVNVRTINGTTDQNCSVVSEESGLALYQCTIIWDMPLNTAMNDGIYHVDANVVSVSLGDDTQLDTNAFVNVVVSTRLANAATVQALLLVISMIIFAGLLVAAVLSIGVLGADPAKTAVTLVGVGIIAAVLMSILGVIALMI